MAGLVRPSPRCLRDFTTARVALRTSGYSVATEELLRFQLAHAEARDAVHDRFDVAAFAARLERVSGAANPMLQLRSKASDRRVYLRHPDLGRTLHPESEAQLQHGSGELAIVVADGLSAKAVDAHALPLLANLLPLLDEDGWSLTPICIVEQARVAIGDPIGLLLGARCSLVLIGERPGLSTPKSLGAYITWNPRPECTDADRNCLSNIHDDGLQTNAAAARLRWLLAAARRMGQTGIALKEGQREPERLGDAPG